MANRGTKDIEKVLDNIRIIRGALARGVRRALREHKDAGLPVVQWRNGKVVWVPPEEIVVDGEPARRKSLKRRRNE